MSYRPFNRLDFLAGNVRNWPRLCNNIQLLLCHSRVAFTIAIESL